MKSINPIQAVRSWYARAEARGLSRLTPEERSELVSFDGFFRRRAAYFSAALILSWLALGVLVKLTSRFEWLGSLALGAVFVLSIVVALTSAWFGPSRFKSSAKGVIILVLFSLAGVLAGGLSVGIISGNGVARIGEDLMRLAPKLLIGGLVTGLIYAVLMVSIVQYRRRQLQGRNELLARQARQERMGRQLADARLKLMQAQVEPHFLFNTLATVQQLAEGKAPEAARMTAQLITFLRGGLASLREDGSTLGREFKSIEAYLGIMQTRMGERLTFSIELPEDIRDVAVPPAMLISLVENAIKHGLEPRPEGGHLDISAQCVSGRVRIAVVDTGLGPNTLNSGGGVGLDNIRQRLRVLYSDRARLTVAPNEPHGFVATIDLPMHELPHRQNLNAE